MFHIHYFGLKQPKYTSVYARVFMRRFTITKGNQNVCMSVKIPVFNLMANKYVLCVCVYIFFVCWRLIVPLVLICYCLWNPTSSLSLIRRSSTTFLWNCKMLVCTLLGKWNDVVTHSKYAFRLRVGGSIYCIQAIS